MQKSQRLNPYPTSEETPPVDPASSKPQKSKYGAWWPQVTTADEAKKAAMQGVGSAIFVAGVTIIFALLSIFGKSPIAQIDATAFIDVVLFLIIAFGIYKMSRIAAVAGLVLFIFEKILLPPTSTGAIIIALVIVLGFVSAIRGTFAYRKLKNQTP